MSDAAALPQGWLRTSIGAETEERKERVGSYADPPTVLSSTKHHGLVPSDDFFRNRTVYSDDLSNYKSVSRNWFAYATNHLAEGSIGLQDRYSSACVSPIYTVFSCREGTDPRYLYRLLKSPQLISQYKLHEQASVDRRGAVRYRDFAKIPLVIPPLAEQWRIEQILDTVDEAIRLAERLTAKLEQCRQGLLNDVITRGIDQTGQLRDVRNREQFKESDLGIIPRSWRVKRLAELGHIRSGSTPSRSMSSRYFADDGLPWVKTLDLNEGLIFDTDERVSDTAIRECSCPLLRPGTILIAMYGGWAQIGRTGLLAVAGTINQAISSIEVVDGAVLPEYLLIALQHGRDRWKAIGASTRKDPNITRQDVLTFEVPIPPMREQELILEVNAGSNARLTTECKNLSKLRLLKQGLMDDLLSGQVRVGASA